MLGTLSFTFESPFVNFRIRYSRNTSMYMANPYCAVLKTYRAIESRQNLSWSSTSSNAPLESVNISSASRKEKSQSNSTEKMIKFQTFTHTKLSFGNAF